MSKGISALRALDAHKLHPGVGRPTRAAAPQGINPGNTPAGGVGAAVERLPKPACPMCRAEVVYSCGHAVRRTQFDAGPLTLDHWPNYARTARMMRLDTTGLVTMMAVVAAATAAARTADRLSHRKNIHEGFLYALRRHIRRVVAVMTGRATLAMEYYLLELLSKLCIARGINFCQRFKISSDEMSIAWSYFLLFMMGSFSFLSLQY